MRWPGDVRVAVNLSPIQFRRGNMVQDVLNALATSGLAGEPSGARDHRVGAVPGHARNARRCCAQLRDLGVRISLDDFGTGYSSLSYLHSFPLQKVKIDRSFLQGSRQRRPFEQLLHGIARLSADLGMSVAVEGIETDEQLALVLAEPAITEAQGFLFSRPVAKREIRALLAVTTPYVRRVA